jgi:hypothetical protein
MWTLVDSLRFTGNSRNALPHQEQVVEVWPRWNHWLAPAETLLSAFGQSSKTRFYNMLGKEDQSCKVLKGALLAM